MTNCSLLVSGLNPLEEEEAWTSRVEHMIPWGMEWIFEEGKRLYEEGAVKELRKEPSGTISAIVRDEDELHPVCLSFLPPPLFGDRRHYVPSFLGDLSTLCLCPETRNLCQHTVAVLLASHRYR